MRRQRADDEAAGPARATEMAPLDPNVLIEIRDLRVHFHLAEGLLTAVHGIDLTEQICYNAAAGEPPINLTDLDPKGEAYREVRGNQISMIFQEPMSTLSPVQRSAIRSARSSRSIRGCRRRRRDLAVELLDRVGIADPNRRIDQ